ncbi:MAG: hypothetical protein FRX49_04319 [Trebouxia sp. A1-2]|nr:MAG: hypothetical protein FRX49_04319 [Trebouxia sp. A1-2]
MGLRPMAYGQDSGVTRDEARIAKKVRASPPPPHARSFYKRYKGPYLEHLSRDAWKTPPKSWRHFFYGQTSEAVYNVPENSEHMQERIEENLVTYLSPEYPEPRRLAQEISAVVREQSRLLWNQAKFYSYYLLDAVRCNIASSKVWFQIKFKCMQVSVFRQECLLQMEKLPIHPIHQISQTKSAKGPEVPREWALQRLQGGHRATEPPPTWLGHAMSTVDGHGYLQPLLAWGRIPVAWALPQIPGQMALSFQLISELAAGAEGSLSSLV